MEFLNPAALYAFALLPLLAIPYLLRARPKRMVFSSLVLLRELVARPQGRGWKWLRVPPIFFLQLLLLALLFFTMGEPVLSVRPTNIAVILDNSASMQAREGPSTRFELAREEAARQVRALAAKARVDLYVTAPRLERLGDSGLDSLKAQAAIRTLQSYDLGDSVRDPGAMLSDLMESKSYDRVLFLTDHPVERQGEVFRGISVGSPKDNLALGAFQVAPAAFASQRFRATVEVKSFAAKEEKVKVSVNSSGKTLSSRAVTIPAGASVEVSFDDLPAQTAYEATLAVNDALAMDNSRFAVAVAGKDWEVLGVSPRPQAIQSLRSIPGINLKIISPEDYGKHRQDDHELEIFHYSMPETLPSRHALFILPPSDNALAQLGAPQQHPVISGWREPHPLTDYVNFSLFRPSYGRPLAARMVGEPVLESPPGVLALTIEQQGFRYLVLGFDPLPYLGKENLPMSVFTLNIFKWFYGGLGAAERFTGQPIEFPPVPEAGSVVTPDGAKIPLKNNAREFAATFFQGFYRVVRGRETDWLAVNFDSAAESDLLHPVPVRLPEEAKAAGGKPGFFRLWTLLLLGAIALLLLERFLNPPALQPHAASPR
ncbi:MAG: vWA domain-containing protein [Candidatus Binatia bacterium]